MRHTRAREMTRRCCLVATFFSVCSPAVCGFSIHGASLGRTAATGKQISRCRGLRRPRVQLTPSVPVLSATRRSNTYVGEAATTTGDWRNLGPEEERTLCQQILEYRRVQELQEELERTQQRPVTVHEWALAAGYPSAHQLMAALQEGRKAERTMLLCHQGLVQSVAFRYHHVSRNLSPDDLTQEGSVGLLQAVGHFDPTKGTRFSSYAVFRIKASILRAIADKDRLMRIPVHAQDAAMRILAASNALYLETGEAPTDAQLALALSMAEDRVYLYRTSILRHPTEDLDSPVLAESVSGEGRIRGEQWPWEASQLAQAQVVRRDVLRLMQTCLSPTEERALRLRFGLLEGGRAGGREATLTFSEIGRTMELSAEGIRKMVFRAIAKLQESDEANSLLLAYADLI